MEMEEDRPTVRSSMALHTNKADRPAGNYTVALAVLTTVFFMWGFATVLNDILVPHLKAVFSLNYAQSLLVQFVFYLAYLLMAIPAAKVLERIGYKASVVFGLLGMALSAAAFVPAATLQSYGVFLAALFALASSITLLQVAANPYVAVIGPSESASSRLNLVQAFNSMGTTVAPLFGGLLILSRSSSGTAAGAEAMLTAQQRVADVQAVELPYLIIAGVLVALAVLVWRVRLPDLGKETRRAARAERSKHSLWQHRNLVLGVPAICLYLVAEIGIGSTLVNFISLPNVGAMSHASASGYVSIFWGGAMAGRFAGALLLRWVTPERMLASVSIGALVLAVIAIATDGRLSMWCLIAVGLCHSIMFPTIFTLGIRGLGPLTEEGSGLLIMAIAGGALSALQGVIADRIGLQLSYLLPAACYVYVLFYALWGAKATAVLQDERLA
jgi:FHS family L-fucose permease-like MFS transporter